MSQHDRTNPIQLDWTGYVIAEHKGAVIFFVITRLSLEADVHNFSYARLSKNNCGRGGGGASTSNPCTSFANSANSGGIVFMLCAQLAAGSSPSMVIIRKSPAGVC